MSKTQIVIGDLHIVSGNLIITDLENLKDKKINNQTILIKGLVFWGKNQDEIYNILSSLKYNIRPYNDGFLIKGNAKSAQDKIQELKSINNWKVAYSFWYDNDLDKISKILYNGGGVLRNLISAIPCNGKTATIIATIKEDTDYKKTITKIEIEFK